MKISGAAADLARRTRGAFSRPRFAPGEWEETCELLLGRYTSREAEAFLQSTHLRHGLDALGVVSGADGADVMSVVKLLDEGRLGDRGRARRGGRGESGSWMDDLVKRRTR